MNAKQMVGALALLVVLIGIYLAMSADQGVRKTVKSNVFAVDSTQVVQVVLESGDGLLHFARSGEAWLLEKYPVDTGRFDPLFQALTGLKTDRLVSSNAANFPKYGVDSSATQMRLLGAGDTELLSFYVGKQGAGFNETLVRPLSEDKVYSVNANLSRFQSAQKSDYWDKTMVEFDAAFVSKVDFGGKYSYGLSNTPEGWLYDGQPADSAKVVRLVDDLSRLRATKVLAEDATQEAELLETVHVTMSDGREIDLKFYAQGEQANSHWVKAGNKDKIFEVNKGRLDNFEKGYEDLKAEEAVEVEVAEE